MKFYRVSDKERKILDSSLYLEKRYDKNLKLYYVQIEDYTIINKGIHTTKVRRDSAEHAILIGNWLELTDSWRLV
jgi:hypothetical protein